MRLSNIFDPYLLIVMLSWYWEIIYGLSPPYMDCQIIYGLLRHLWILGLSVDCQSIFGFSVYLWIVSVSVDSQIIQALSSNTFGSYLCSHIYNRTKNISFTGTSTINNTLLSTHRKLGANDRSVSQPRYCSQISYLFISSSLSYERSFAPW
jgi:hypothetical protein